MDSPPGGWVLPPAPPTKDDVIAGLRVQIEMLRAREARLVGALEFYADKKSYKLTYPGSDDRVWFVPVSRDRGRKAQQALAARPDAGGDPGGGVREANCLTGSPQGEGQG